jgi:putative transposase
LEAVASIWFDGSYHTDHQPRPGEATMGDDTPSAIGALQVDETRLKGHVDEVVRSSVEETLNGLLDAEADQICRAQRYEHSPERVDRRAGHYERKLETKAGEVRLKIPKLRTLPFETAIIERYRRREESVEEALVEMYLAGVSVRRVEDITEAMWGTRVSSGTVSRLNQKIYRHIEAWRNREIIGDFPYLYLDGVVLKRSWAGEVRNVSVLIAIGVGTDGFRQILGVAEGEREDLQGWRSFLCHLKDRGLKGVRLIVSDACRGLVEAAAEVYAGTDWQRCMVHFYRNVFSHVPNGKVAEVARMLKAIHAQEDRRAAQNKASEIVARLKEIKLRTAAELVEQKVSETLTYYAYPSTHWRQLRTNNPLERIIREIRRRTRVVGAFPDGHSALMLVAARLRHIASTRWGKRRYMAMELLLNPAKHEAAA